MIVIELGILVLVALTGTCVALTRNPVDQAIGISLFGLILAMMFMIFQAPDVALSQIVVGAVGLPLMIMLALSKLRRDDMLRRREASHRQTEHS